MLKNVSKKMWDSLHLFRSRRVILPGKAKQSQTNVIKYEGKSVQNHMFQKKTPQMMRKMRLRDWARTVNGVINPACEARFNLDPPIAIAQ